MGGEEGWEQGGEGEQRVGSGHREGGRQEGSRGEGRSRNEGRSGQREMMWERDRRESVKRKSYMYM